MMIFVISVVIIDTIFVFLLLLGSNKLNKSNDELDDEEQIEWVKNYIERKRK